MAKPEYCLRTIDGGVVTVSDDKQTLYADDVQNENGQRVHIEEKTIEGAKCMAFIFWHDEKKYGLMVNDVGQLQLEKKDIEENLTLCNCYWFEKYNDGSGEHYGLRSVVEPKQYICRPCEDEPFCLSLTNDNLVHVINEEIQ